MTATQLQELTARSMSDRSPYRDGEPRSIDKAAGAREIMDVYVPMITHEPDAVFDAEDTDDAEMHIGDLIADLCLLADKIGIDVDLLVEEALADYYNDRED